MVLSNSKQCPLTETTTTCDVDATDQASTKPSTVPHALCIASRCATTTLVITSIALYCTMQASRDAFRYANTILVPKSSVPARVFSPEILHILSKQCPLIDIETTCEVDATDITKPLTVPHALRIVSRYLITALVVGSLVFYCIMLGSWQILLGCAGNDPLKLLIRVVATMVVALIA
jgi:hypothetical protein